MSSNDTANTSTTPTVTASHFNIRKKKKHALASKQAAVIEESLYASVQQQDSHSCDEKETNIEKDKLEQFEGVSQRTSNNLENTTTHQSNNSNTNSQETINSSS